MFSCNEQSRRVKSGYPLISTPMVFLEGFETAGVSILGGVLNVVTILDMEKRLTAEKKLRKNCCFKLEEYEIDNDEEFSGMEVLDSYLSVKDSPPIKLEGSDCFITGTTSMIDRILYSHIIKCDPNKPLCCNLKMTDKDVLACVAASVLMPLLCPCFALMLICARNKKPPKKISKIDEVQSIISSLRSVEDYIDTSPDYKYFYFCCKFPMTIDKDTMKLLIGFRLLDRVDEILLSSIGTMSDIRSVYIALRSSASEDQKVEIDKHLQELPMRLPTEAKRMIDGTMMDKYSDQVNQELKDYLIANRICRDFVSNDLVDRLFHNKERTPIGTSKNFLTERSLYGQTEESVFTSIKNNHTKLGLDATKIHPTILTDVIKLLKTNLKSYFETARVKQPTHVIKKYNQIDDKIIKKKRDGKDTSKEEEEKVKGVQDLYGMRFFIPDTRIFSSFVEATICAEKIKKMDNVQNVIVSHKLKLNTSYLDYKILIEFKNNAIVEIEIIPSKNFIMDEAIDGHDAHKKE
jgi:hypothetical protein